MDGTEGVHIDVSFKVASLQLHIVFTTKQIKQKQ